MRTLSTQNLTQCKVEFLASIFDSPLSVGCIPNSRRHAIVTPIYKGGLVTYASNYRLISLIWRACKNMESYCSSNAIPLTSASSNTQEKIQFLVWRIHCLKFIQHIKWLDSINSRISIAVALRHSGLILQTYGKFNQRYVILLKDSLVCRA